MRRILLLCPLLAAMACFALASDRGLYSTGHSGSTISPAKVHSINATPRHHMATTAAANAKSSGTEKELNQLEEKTARLQTSAAPARSKTSNVSRGSEARNTGMDFKLRSPRGKGGHGSGGKGTGRKSHGRR